MALPLSQAAVREKSDVVEVGVIALVISLLVHASLAAVTVLRIGFDAPPPPATGSEEMFEADVESNEDKENGDVARRGEENKAQGERAPAPPATTDATPTPSPPVEPPPAPTPAPSPPLTDATSEPAPRPPPSAAPIAPNATAAPTAPPTKPRTPARASSALANASADPSAGASDGEPPGDGGGQKRTGAPDLGATFAFELPDSASFVATWATLPKGDAGTLEARIEIGADGKVRGGHVTQKRDDPPAYLIDSFDRVVGRLKFRTLTLDDGAQLEGAIVVRIRAVVSDVPAPDTPGGAVGFNRHFDTKKRKGESAFTLVNGRRVDFTFEVVKVEHS